MGRGTLCTVLEAVDLPWAVATGRSQRREYGCPGLALKALGGRGSPSRLGERALQAGRAHTTLIPGFSRKASLGLAQTLTTPPLGRLCPRTVSTRHGRAPCRLDGRGLVLASCSPGPDPWTAFLFKPTFVVCVSVSPLPLLFI